MDKQREAPRGGNIDFHFRKKGRREERVTERTWALLIICITVIFIAAIIADCIKSVKGIRDKAEKLQKFEPELWAHNIPCPPHKAPITKGVIVGSKEWQEDE